MSRNQPESTTAEQSTNGRAGLVQTEVTADRDGTSGPADAVVSTNDLDVYYGDDQALQGVSLDIPEERVTALIGPSGCGKSTYLRCLNRMNDRISTARVEGTVELRGTDVYGNDVDPVALRRKIGMVFQTPNPFSKSIYDNVAYGLRVQGYDGNDDERVETALRRAALWDEVKGRLERSALDLSGGQQQRVCIARAIAPDPEVILMDEPTSALDPVATSKIEDLIDDTETIFESPDDQRVEDYITGKFG